MPPATDDGSLDTGHPQLRYGLGVVVEATNETGQILRDASFEGVLTLTGNGGEQKCHFGSDALSNDSGARFLSFSAKPPPDLTAPAGAPPPKTSWFDDSGSSFEAPWRPAERIRMVSRRSDCRSAALDDMGVTAIHGHLVVKARKEFTDALAFELDDKGFDLSLDGETLRIRDLASSKLTIVPLKDVVEMIAAPRASTDGSVIHLSRVKLARFVRASEADVVEGEALDFDLNPASLTLQLVKLPSGDFVHASGNVVVYLHDGKVTFDDMAKLKLSLHDVERKDVPAEPEAVSFESDELSGKVTDLKLIHFTEEPALAKGQRKLTATWKLSLQSDAIDGRLKAAVDAATATLEAAERVELQADVGNDAEARSKAKADLAKAKSEKSAADSKYRSSLSGERSRLAKLLTCGDIRLVTNRGVRTAQNARAATDLCHVLDKVNDVEVTLAYTLDRYELPIALTYSLGKGATLSPIASARLMKLDPR